MCRHGGRTLSNTYGPGTGRIWLDDVVCFGHEMQFASCQHRYWGSNNCEHSNDVSIVCDRRTFGMPHLSFSHTTLTWCDCDELVCLSVCLSVCTYTGISLELHIRTSLHVACGHSSVVQWGFLIHVYFDADNCVKSAVKPQSVFNADMLSCNRPYSDRML